MLVENLIACRLVLVKTTISTNSIFDGKSNIPISHHWQNLKDHQGKKIDHHLEYYLRTLLIGPFYRKFNNKLILKTVNIDGIREKLVPI